MRPHSALHATFAPNGRNSLEFFTQISSVLAPLAAFRQNDCATWGKIVMTAVNYRRHTLFTIGHSNLELQDFLSVLTSVGVQVLCDVRSRPGSSRFPQFDRAPLQAGLASAKIGYEFLGETLGGRPSDRSVYRSDGRVDYELRRKAQDFRAGIERILELLTTQKIALMCAEEDPLQCHRFLMICPSLLGHGVEPVHVRRGGVLESQREAEDRLLSQHDLSAFTSDALFSSERDSVLPDALRRQAEDFAFRGSPEISEDF